MGAFREAMRLNPDDGATHNSLALVLATFPTRHRGDYEQALAHAKRAVELGPDKENRHGSLARAEYRVGHWTESLAASERSMALTNGGHALNWFLMALASWQKGEKDKARSWYDKAVQAARTTEKHPNDVELRQLWTEAAELLGRPGPGPPGASSPAVH